MTILRVYIIADGSVGLLGQEDCTIPAMQIQSIQLKCGSIHTAFLDYLYIALNTLVGKISTKSKHKPQGIIFSGLWDDSVIIPERLRCNTMVIEEIEIPSGWPLGLGNMNVRFRVEETSITTTRGAYISRPIHSSSFSSFSSSNLDTESTASFFPDRSVSLGRLIGLQPRNRGNSYHPNTILNQQHGNMSVTRAGRNEFEGQDNPQGLCVPLLHNVIGKMGRSRSSTRH
ncbi:Uncharacterized protein Adt_09265 [Abeliophyllum distichum]|uniref:Uncharacterized protein n=1 Tax=Abeliophyllum distichum TaxID=126358 RepID=A0ABD1UGW4_9LAMI